MLTRLADNGRSTKSNDVESQDPISSSEKSVVKKTFKVDARIISDATIGLSDGLTVPFALTAGLSALGNTRVVIYGGLAELIAGAISMGLGGYLGAKSEAFVLFCPHLRKTSANTSQVHHIKPPEMRHKGSLLRIPKPSCKISQKYSSRITYLSQLSPTSVVISQTPPN